MTPTLRPRQKVHTVLGTPLTLHLPLRLRQFDRKRPKIHPLGRAARPARLRPCLLQKHPGLGDVTDEPLTRGSWKWKCRRLSSVI